MRYVVEYNNDTGPNDDYFVEWWEVQDTENKKKVVCQCDTKHYADLIASLLNDNPRHD